MWPILVCSIVAFALIVTKAFQFKVVLNRLLPFKEEAMERLPPEVAPLVERIESGCDEKTISLAGSRTIRNLAKGLGLLSLTSTIAPLLGFTGTVTGMIQAFMVIAVHTGGRVEPSMVAGGIYEALITTACGLFVAIPSHVALHFLENELDEISFRMKEIAMALLERRNHGI